MRVVIGVLYWLSVGVLALLALYSWFATNRILVPWWSIPASLALFGAWWPGLGYSGAGLVAFGAYPALFVTSGVAEQVVYADWSCSGVAFGGADPAGGPGGCTTFHLNFILVGLIFLAIALLGVVLLLRQAQRGGAGGVLKSTHRST